MMAGRPPRLLAIAGSDSGGGAGIQADLKVFAAHGVYGLSVVTAVTAQNTREIRAVHAIPPDIVGAQIDAVLADIGADAAKIGMLVDAPTVAAVAERLRAHPRFPIVLDPVLASKNGTTLLTPAGVEALCCQLLPLAALVTPNLPEAAQLTGLSVATESERVEVARRLAEQGPAVLLKGGHGEGAELVDLLWADGQLHRFRHPRRETKATHGAGCALSAAIAARLGRGESLVRAVEGAIGYLQQALAAAFPVGAGHGPPHHLFAMASYS